MRLFAPFSVAGAVLALACAAGPAAAAPLTNGDFSAGFSGWSGNVDACDDPGCTTTTLTSVGTGPGDQPFANWPQNFQLTADGAVLATSFSDNNVFFAELFQVFMVDALASGSTGLALTFFLDYELSDDAEFVTAKLWDPADPTLASVDLLNGSRADITAYAGRTVELGFRLGDFDGVEDRLRIRDIRIEQVPVPAPIVLLTVGLGALAGRHRLLSQQSANQE